MFAFLVIKGFVYDATKYTIVIFELNLLIVFATDCGANCNALPFGKIFPIPATVVINSITDSAPLF